MMRDRAAVKRVTAFVGTPRKKHTYGAVREFLDRLEALGGVECEIVTLSDYRIETCRGCKVCFEKGEEFCPLKDDRDIMIDKMLASDGVVFASPNYSFQVSGIMKTFLDRLGFVFHRPRFHGKAFTSIVVQGVYGGRKIVKYLSFAGGGLGFDVVKGSCSTAFEPMTRKDQEKRNRALARQSERFYKELSRSGDRVPSLLKLMLFRMGRTSINITLDDKWRDYTYYSEHGWFESDYYYPTHLGLLKRSAGTLFDSMFARIFRARAVRE
jgi:multimeric flavodoxin WrbA